MLPAILETLGIAELYPPQREALEPVERGASILMAVPTAAGKSLVAYVALLRAAAVGRRGLYLVPLRALAWEKVNELRDIAAAVLPGCRVGVTVGDYDRAHGLGRYDIVVATCERADSLLRNAPEWLPEVGCLVADEVHLLNDTHRGPTLEVALTRFRALNPDLQVVALSATVSNADEIAAWLGAELVASAFRPVPLRRGLCLDTRLEWEDGEAATLPQSGAPGLVAQALPGQTLLFVGTRRSAEAQARKLTTTVRATLTGGADRALATLADELAQGGEEATRVDEGLARLLRNGVAYHHAGLSHRQRSVVERGFRDRALKVLVATPTLAAGVNLPAHRVVVRDLSRWDETLQAHGPLPVLEVLQMLGRAGRPGYDTQGEGVLVVKDLSHRDDADERYLNGEPEPVRSKLGSEPALRMHLLAAVVGGLATDREALHAFLGQTLFGAQGELWRTQHRLNRVLDFLEAERLIEIAGAGSGDFVTADQLGRESFAATEFGRRVAQLYIDPLSGVLMRQALESGIEPTPLGLLHALARTPDLRSLFVRRNEKERYFALLAEVGDRLLLPPPTDRYEAEFYLWDLKTARLLEAWADEVPEGQLLDRFSVQPGDIRAKVDIAEWLLYAMSEMAALLAPDAAPLLRELRLRVSHGIRAELLPLMAMEGVGRVRARTLHAAGYTDPEAMRTATPAALAALPGIGSRLAAQLGGADEAVEPSGPAQARLKID